MPIRNPFKRSTGLPDSTLGDDSSVTANGGGAKPIQVQTSNEYKLSEINDSGVYLPPSPTTEKPSFWHSRSSASTTSSNHRSLLSENEPFSISRESFDSYRRSFDISARSPVSDDSRSRPSLDSRPRQSLDSRLNRLPRTSMNEYRNEKNQITVEEGFEDVGLNDEVKPKKRGLFSRFADSAETNSTQGQQSDSRPSSSHHGFHFTGRKRGQSGQGAELKSMPRPIAPEISVESR